MVYVVWENDKLNLIANILLAALISSALVTPLVFLELHYASQDYSEFPYLLFAVLWLLPAAFVLTITPLVRAVRAGKRLLAHPATLVVRIAFLALVAMLWMGGIHDQLPCFLGVPNCD